MTCLTAPWHVTLHCNMSHCTGTRHIAPGHVTLHRDTSHCTMMRQCTTHVSLHHDLLHCTMTYYTAPRHNTAPGLVQLDQDMPQHQDTREILILKEPLKCSVPSVFLFHLKSWSQKYFGFQFFTNFRGVVSFLTVLNQKGPPLGWKNRKIVR